ncbi:ankyrin [Anaeromyces robustus]|uniref:Ankyrin n=1 Tax=Anaeromyces robustus TaxID=1754192 RepID=A0A1Y1VQF8_9FUNG|nr:ankyrin [Anaeromyces robustus]|eukprot:ORX63256.1 ankyrin [Anaeromyces robustus]
MPGLDLSDLSESTLWVVAGEGNIEKIKRYLEYGGQNNSKLDINSKDEFGYTALHAAVSYSRLEAARWLLEHGADVNITDDDGDTPLHSCESVAMAKMLIEEFNADPLKKNDEGKMPIDNAYEEDYDDLVEYLKNYCKDFNPDPKELSDDEVLNIMLGEFEKANENFNNNSKDNDSDYSDDD